ncbi:hypothetical protein [Treponema brennaborense]|uniref:Uncharacterized protein n=1 Tax=Treponema brennaborense (strain DSM 12168 / CIP 105900 / DD5/3) TaxID=906968 RepID=F4LLL5_TREBD|nr:hypothetical protein [Treponema brennaborense]AEE16679.1 hypothetical protein Trebr_1251 [Treponema brennaborense DSM 12168]
MKNHDNAPKKSHHQEKTCCAHPTVPQDTRSTEAAPIAEAPQKNKAKKH